MDHTHSWICCVDVLATSTWCSFCLNDYIFLIDFKIMWCIRCDQNSASWTVKSTCFFSFWNSLDFMNSRLKLKIFVYIFTIDIIEDIFASLADSHISLKFFFFESPALKSEEICVHSSDIIRKQTTLATPSRLHYFKRTAILLISFRHGQNMFHNFVLYFFNFSIVFIVTNDSSYVIF